MLNRRSSEMSARPSSWRRRRARWGGWVAIFSAIAGAVVVFASAPAAANGRFPAANQLVLSPTTQDLVVLRTTYGVLVSRDNGATWSLICEAAYGLDPNATIDPSIALTSNDTLIAGVPTGLNVSPDVGCNWRCADGALAGERIADVAVRPDSPAAAVALTATFVQTDSPTASIHSQVFETRDNGVTWAAIGVPIDPTVSVATIEVAKLAPERLYVSGVRFFGSTRTASLFVSMNKGQTWTEHVLPASQFDPDHEDSIYIAAIDPRDADRVYIRSHAYDSGGLSRLTAVTLGADGGFDSSMARFVDGLTDAGGAASTFNFTLDENAPVQMLGFALSPDGSKVYVGSPEQGLWSASASDMVFRKVSPIGVQCLATRGTELWACSASSDGFVAGVSTDDGVTFAPRLASVGGYRGPIACGAGARQAACGEDAGAAPCATASEESCDADACGGPALGASPPSVASAPSTSCSVVLVTCGGGTAVLAMGLSIAGLALQRRRARRSS
jgi:hypothetical protein